MLFAPVPDHSVPPAGDDLSPALMRMAVGWSAEGLGRDLLNLYQNDHPEMGLSLEVMSSAQAVTLVEQGAVEAALVVVPHGVGLDGVDGAEALAWRIVAVDALAVIVHPSRCSEGLSLDQLRQLYAGYTLDWSEMGQVSGEPMVVVGEPGATSRTLLQETVLRGEAVTSAARVLADDRRVLAAVAADSQAVALVPATLRDKSVCALPINGVAPEPANIVSGAYPLGYDLLLVWPAQVSEGAADLERLVFSSSGRALIKAHYGGSR